MVLAVVGVVAVVVLVALGSSWLVGQVVTSFSDVRPPWAEDSPPGPDGPDRGESPTASDGPEPDEAPTVPPPEVPADAEAAIVDRVVDGDTVRVVAAPGGSIRGGGSIRVRLLNIDAPELDTEVGSAECGARAATEHLARLLAAGDVVWLVADREERDVYDRPLRGMWTSEGLFVNEVLAEEGFAEAILVGSNDRFHDRIVAAVDRARRESRGIWGELCRG